MLSQAHPGIFDSLEICEKYKLYGCFEKYLVALLVSWSPLSSKDILLYLTEYVIVNFRDCKYVLSCMEVANNVH